MILESIKIDNLPATARCWVFQSSRELNSAESWTIRERLEMFLGGWAAHGQDLHAACDIRHGRFIIIALDEQQAGATGCSIDKMMKEVQVLNADFQMDCLNRMKVAYQEGQAIQECSVAELQTKYANGELNDQSLVYDNTIQTIGELQEKWLVPLESTWCAQMVG